ncbi:MAG TPA: type II toxin-antitoxin system VapC family toxin [Stellaceae bacterium]|jgi:PIN domain nuclease of toxin-antitoxin system|nr:type II toxin-antitoxin system VapC family toxin [Stellaceae bacterium]
MTGIVLDASALLALLRSERGGERVGAVLNGASMTSVNFSEVVQHYARHGVAEVDIRKTLAPLPLACVPFDEELAYDAGLLIKKTHSAGLSFGDRACLALARRLGAKVLTADRAWSRVAAATGTQIEIIR